jgi:hypothetical protein
MNLYGTDKTPIMLENSFLVYAFRSQTMDGRVGVADADQQTVNRLDPMQIPLI